MTEHIKRGPFLTKDMRQAVRDGRKTRHSVLIKPQPWPGWAIHICASGTEYGWRSRTGLVPSVTQPIPYTPGQIIYMPEPLWKHDTLGVAVYADDCRFRSKPHMDNALVFDTGTELLLPWRWQSNTLSASQMPREAARTFLRITNVKAERVQEIVCSASSIMAEGILYDVDAKIIGPCEADAGDLIEQFSAHWNTRYPGSWERNDWRWVYTWEIANGH